MWASPITGDDSVNPVKHRDFMHFRWQQWNVFTNIHEFESETIR